MTDYPTIFIAWGIRAVKEIHLTILEPRETILIQIYDFRNENSKYKCKVISKDFINNFKIQA